MNPNIITTCVDPDELYHPPPGVVIRAGIIPYIIHNEQRYYLLGLFPDRIFTDMGGGCKTSRSERPIDCLVREINEETDPITAKVVIRTLFEQSDHLEAWRQTAQTFRDYGYPFRQRQSGPIYRYYVFLKIDDPEMKLGGLTCKEEVESYHWVSDDELKAYPNQAFSSSCRDFLISQHLIKA